jgi:hypothetical protein
MAAYNTSGTFIESVANAVQRLRDFKYMTKGTSLIEASQAASVNPILIVDESLSGMQQLTEISGVVQNMFAAYYLSAASLMTSVNGVKISETLGPLNPNRSVFESKAVGLNESAIDLYSHETHNLSIHKSLPFIKDYEKTQNSYSKESLEQGSIETSDVAKEYSPLSVGRVYDINVGNVEDDKAGVATVKVVIQMLAFMVKTSYMTDMLTFRSHTDMALPERWFNFKIGKIGILDLLFQRDLIAKHRNMLIKDKTGLYKEIVERRNRGTLQGLLSGKPSLAAISNIALISKETALSVEDKLNGQLSKFNIRNAAMESTGLMVLGVVDGAYERVTFYLHSKEVPVIVNFKDFKLGSKANAKLEDMLALMVGNQGSNVQRF